MIKIVTQAGGGKEKENARISKRSVYRDLQA
jgi:hypothetical protein